MKLWLKWSHWVNDGSAVGLFYFGLLFLAATQGVNSFAGEIVPWVQNIFANPYHGELAEKQFLLTSLLLPLTASALQISTQQGLEILNGAIFILGSYWVLKVYATEGKERFLVQAFLLYSLSAGLLLWFGKSDMWFFVLSTLLVFYRKHFAVSLGVALLLGLTHFEQGLVVVAMLGLMFLVDLSTGQRLRDVFKAYFAILIGIALAKVMLLGFFALNEFGRTEGRLEFVFARGYEVFVEPALKNAGVLVFSYLSLFWLVFFGLASAFNVNKFSTAAVWLAFLVAMGVSFLTYDTTRVFSIVFWPFIVYMILETPVSRLEKVFNKQFMPMLIAAALLFPTVQVKKSGELLFVGVLNYQKS
ncbi:hypothetical protein [Thiomicrorhabdus sp.]|uniref:hypothetical protein n=1 Tax=Thiomicrorhabdus sp. TaxID=2039724 RepID=UPI0029C7C6D3|nr:hypothetical protein [Thiomicrorhabdus sp.]